MESPVFEGSLKDLAVPFYKVGWFIPPYITLGFLSDLAHEINQRGASFSQSDLQIALSEIYSPSHLAVMVTERYKLAPFVKDFRETISESIEAHMLGLNHIAVSGLMPAIEGISRKLLVDRNKKSKAIKGLLMIIAKDCIREAREKTMGDLGEITSMMQSFAYFADHFLFIDSAMYGLTDRTNRHGLSHGHYDDKEYGQPISFYKLIATIDFLTFISSFRARISWWFPNPTPACVTRLDYYRLLIDTSSQRPRRS